MAGVVLVVGGLLLSVACTKRLKLSLVDEEVDAAVASVRRPTPEVPPPTASGPGTDDPAEGLGGAGRAGGAAPAPAPTPPKVTGLANTCAGVCEKTLRCLNAFNAVEQSACVAKCGKPEPTRFARLNAMDCPTLLATLQAENNGGGGNGNNGNGGGTQPCGPNECSTCVWDGSSCYSRVPPHLACDACCCRKGGPAPRWD